MSESIHDIEVNVVSPGVRGLVKIDGKTIPITGYPLHWDVGMSFPVITLHALQLPGYTPVTITGTLHLERELPNGLVEVTT